jgi:hypothetical protein
MVLWLHAGVASKRSNVQIYPEHFVQTFQWQVIRYPRKCHIQCFETKAPLFTITQVIFYGSWPLQPKDIHPFDLHPGEVI